MPKYNTASEYWTARKERERERAVQTKGLKELLINGIGGHCRLCGKPMTKFGGCVSAIGSCPNAYTD